MWWSILLLVAIQLAAAKAIERRWTDFEVKHAWDRVPSGWVRHGAAPQDYTLDLRIGLKQDKFDELVEHLYEVSDPSHQRYGSHLSKAEIDALVAPHSDTIDIVNEWLEHHDIDTTTVKRSSSGDWLSLSVPIYLAERMFNTNYSTYHHPDSATYVVRTEGYSLPSELLPHVDVVSPTTYFGGIKPKDVYSFSSDQPPITPEVASEQLSQLERGKMPTRCDPLTTPACLMKIMNMTGYVPTAMATNKLGVVGYLEQYANMADLKKFLNEFRPDAALGSYETVLVNGGLDDQSKPGHEANLDIQYAMSLSYPTPNIYYSVGGSPPFKADKATPMNNNEPYLEWLTFILTEENIPQTFTTSYGDSEQTVPYEYATRVCNMFAQLGARGSSVLFASGDFGVGREKCRTNDNDQTVIFQPEFPSSCPFVTSVGSTFNYPEVVADFSGGGFSRHFERPSYQNAQVESYLTRLGDKYEGLYNPTGRAYPDIAGQGYSFQVIVGNITLSISGTSASSPAVAAVIALLNDYRIANGKPPLGFLNPLLYSPAAASTFNDITSGRNPGCKTAGFEAGAGWDPVTGLGTPNFGKLQPVVLSVAG